MDADSAGFAGNKIGIAVLAESSFEFSWQFQIDFHCGSSCNLDVAVSKLWMRWMHVLGFFEEIFDSDGSKMLELLFIMSHVAGKEDL